jgi:2-desacetyl-2-hydroxyethyl bacteriochlorophyllide A dehydrogenase
MNTLVCVEPGKFEYQEREKPSLTEGNAIIKIKRIGICGTDLHAYEGTQPFFSYPRVLGHELSGELVEINGPSDFKKGEAVTFIPYYPCLKCVACKNGKPNCCVNIRGCGVHIDGGMAEYISVPTYALIHGDGLSFDELALVEPLAIGAHAVRLGNIKPGEFVLVTGAGPIGLGVMEFARIAGAKVIAMDINNERLAFCRDILKVDYSINSMEQPAEEALSKITNGDWPTLIIDATGNRKSILSGFNYLAHGGRIVLVGIQREEVSFNHPEFHKRESTLMSSRNATREDFEHVIRSMKAGKVHANNYITHRATFDKLKAEFPTWIDPKAKVVKAMVEMK